MIKEINIRELKRLLEQSAGFEDPGPARFARPSVRNFDKDVYEAVILPFKEEILDYLNKKYGISRGGGILGARYHETPTYKINKSGGVEIYFIETEAKTIDPSKYSHARATRIEKELKKKFPQYVSEDRDFLSCWDQYLEFKAEYQQTR